MWRDKAIYQVSPHREEGIGDVWIDELEQTEGFGVYAAAGLIKQWYKDLRSPIFPQESYAAVEKFYGDTNRPFETRQLLEMLSEEATWSVLPKISRF